MLSLFSYLQPEKKLHPPSKPRSLHKAPTKVTLSWDKPEQPNGTKVKGYVVSVHKFVKEEFMEIPIAEDDDVSLEINDLDPDCQYRFSVKAVYEGDGEVCESDLSDVINTDRPSNQPGRPLVSQVTSGSILVKWEPPSEVGMGLRVTGYQLICENADTRHLAKKIKNIDPSENPQHEVTGLWPNRRYMFAAIATFTKGKSQQSEWSPMINLVEKEKDRLCKNARLVSRANPSVYQLNLRQLPCTLQGKIRKCVLGRPGNLHGVQEKVIMIVGATGAGKTTLINGMINYVLGVEWKDKYRFKLVVDEDEAKIQTQAKSQTQWITSYTIHANEEFQIPYTLTVIDTPGFGDTQGIKRDKEITSQIQAFFTTAGDNGIDHLDAIGFVAQSALPRLTPTQQFIFDSILSLFGKDIAENIFLMVTFADGQQPPVLTAVRDADLPYQKYFKFNNSALFAKNAGAGEAPEDDNSNDSKFAEKFWDMGSKSFMRFFENLNETPSKSLLLTQDVLKEREKIETHVVGIQQQIKNAINKMEQLKTEVDVLKTHEADIDKNKDFTYTVEEETAQKEEIPNGRHITNCLQCNFTCHYPCGIPNDSGKAGCAAMTLPGNYCGVCPRNCYWNIHRNERFRYITKRVKTEKSSADLKKRYEDAEGKKLTSEELIKKVVEDVYAVRMKILALTDDVRKSLDRLKEIALKPNPLTHLEFIDILIESEKSEHREGWKERVAQLEDVRKQADTLNQISQDGFDPFAEYQRRVEEAKKDNSTAGGAFEMAFKYIRTKFTDLFKKM